MNTKTQLFIKNFSYTLSSNLVTLLISILVVAIVPKVLGVEEYGYWQLYLFYTLYTALLHFGWNDGVYLRYGGKKYDELDKNLFFSQFWMLITFELVITLTIIGCAGLIIDNPDRLFIITMMLLSSLIVIPRGMLLFILQGTNRMRENAISILIGKTIYFILIIVFILLDLKSYQIMITADLVGKFISFLYTLVCCRDIVFRKLTSFYLDFRETINNISVGIKVSLAFIASTLIIGTVRFGIEYMWDIETFGKVSLTLSISNLMMVFINAIGLILFPVLRRTNEKNLPSIYKDMRNLLTVPLIGILILYYPLNYIMSMWIPEYSESLIYMGLLFPMVLFEGKMSLLINTYLKTLRKEKQMLLINLLSLVLSLIITIFSVLVLQNLTLSILSIVFLLAFRCIVAEIILSKILKITIKLDTFMELSMTIVFILTVWFIGTWEAAAIYLLFYLFYLLIKRHEFNRTIENFRLIMKK
ncbi:oligosaccharide flippase family protein [Rossellomorea aquimaris]|nr:oligosaccharide flippase family protein [Rossellomorea aquimaris]WRP06316.1 oligosaccharide flippase family protein [Rossellomorea aquimaris]